MSAPDMSLITPPSSAKALETALSQNPHLTSLPLPRADILSPSSLTQTSGTAEILRLSEIQDAITGNFLVLPCDLVCELPGESLLSSWMVLQSGYGGSATESKVSLESPKLGAGEENSRRGGLGVWFDTRGEGSVKHEETDFLITAPIQLPVVAPAEGTLRSKIQNVVYFTTKDTLGEITEEKKSLPLRSGLLARHKRLKVQSAYRDAHTYLFPHWVKHMIARNETMDSLSEDVVGWWAKAGWQCGLGEKMGLEEILHPKETHDLQPLTNGSLEDEMDLASMSSTLKSKVRPKHPGTRSSEYGDAIPKAQKRRQRLVVPHILGYIHPSDPKGPLIRRVDTAALLLYVSLRLAKLESIETAGKASASPLAHASKIAYPAGVAQRCTISQYDCLLAENVTVESKCIIKESVIGVNCHIKSGARLTRCVLMDGAVVGERCDLTGCIVGRRAQIGKGSALVECEVQDSNVIPEDTESKGEKFMIFEGLDTPSGDEATGDVKDTEDETFDASQGIDMIET